MSKILLGSMLTAPDNHVLTYVLHSTAFLVQRIRSWRDVWNKHRMCDHSVRISRSTFPYISRESTPCTFLSGPTAVGSSWHCPDSLLRASSVVACFELRVACVSNLLQLLGRQLAIAILVDQCKHLQGFRPLGLVKVAIAVEVKELLKLILVEESVTICIDSL